ncbi:MAG: tellurite-like stress resistance cysteine protease StiP, partial [Gordonia sp. (in: high G+C Gram-positive bacteria)]
STVSGLVSRTVLNADHIGPGEFHGAKFYAHLRDFDVSNLFLDTISGEFPAIADSVSERVREITGGDRAPDWAGWAALEQLRDEFGMGSMNLVKPGVGETTRVLLRRVPWRVLVAADNLPEHAHIRLLAAERGVPVQVYDGLAYSCVGLIKEDS